MNWPEEVTQAWLTAAARLGIDVRTGLSVAGTTFPLLVRDFGSCNGTLPVLIGDTNLLNIAGEAGYFTSQLNPKSYSRFDRAMWVDTLNDWGWFGTKDPPSWYTGRPWSA